MEPKNFWKNEWLIVLIVLLPIPILLYVWSSIPDIIPTHYNAHGEVNGHGSKLTTLILPAMNLVFGALLYFLPKLDPKKKLTQMSPAYRGIRIIVAAMFFMIFMVTLMGAMGSEIDVSRWLMAILMLMFAGLGLYLPKLQPNYFAGIRLPWTLEDPENWRLTHILGGKVSLIAGCVGFVLIWVLPAIYGFVIVMACALSLGLIPAIYSYRLYKAAERKSAAYESRNR